LHRVALIKDSPHRDSIEMQIKTYFIFIFALISNVALAVSPSTSTVAGQWRGLAHTSHESTRLVLDLKNQVGQLTGAMGLSEVGVSGWQSYRTAYFSNQAKFILAAVTGTVSVHGKKIEFSEATR